MKMTINIENEIMGMTQYEIITKYTTNDFEDSAVVLNSNMQVVGISSYYDEGFRGESLENAGFETVNEIDFWII